MARQTDFLADLVQKRQAIDAQIAQAQAQQKELTIQTIRAMMAETGVTIADITANNKVTYTQGNGAVEKPKRGRPKGSKGSKGAKKTVAAPKFRNPATGDTWTGRGPRPQWLRAALDQGKKLESFLI
jgi:DNA-binding protein H-NS